MKNMVKIFSLAMMLVAAAVGTALATPSTQIWIPSTDVQAFTPSPGIMSTAMYYSERSPSSDSVPVVKEVKELMRRKDFLTK